jgi:ubiquitin carboxyl-terminal hydrolase 7
LNEQPDLWLHDSKTDTGFVGLKNQGATCYMNSLLQSLYHVPALQRAVYKMPTEQETSVKRHRTASQHPAVITRQDYCNTPESVALALQRVFYHLQHSSKSVGTKQLTKSFGWDALDAFTQHDVQELDRVLCDNLEEKMKGTPVEKEVPRLFCGKLKNFVKCINVNFSSERTEDFYDLSLNVRGCKNLKESLEKYVEREKLDGDNKYMAEGHGLQDAEKGCTFSSFPPILHLHLKRFEYDPLRDANVKINDRFEFDEEIDLAPYMEEHPGGPEVYLLHSVLVHSGDVNGGHYYAYIRPDCSDRWFKFNDERVTIATRDEAVDSNFGSEDDPDRLPQGQALMIQRNRLGPRRCSNAYMLVYVKKAAVAEVLRPLDKEDIPTHLRDRFKVEEEEEELRRKEKSEAHLKLTLKVATWKHLQQHEEADLHDWHNVLMLQVHKTITIEQLKKTIRETADIHAENLRLWPCCKRKNETIRTQSPTRNPEDVALQHLAPYKQGNTGHACDGVKIFVEELLPGDKTVDRFDDRDALIFFKFWDPQTMRLRYIGHLIFKPTTKVKQMVDAALSRFLPDLAFDEIHALEELKPDKIEDLVYVVHDETRGMDRDAQLQDRQVELQSGDIIVIQPYSAGGTSSCVKKHYDFLFNKVFVSFRAKKDPEKEVFEMQLHGSLEYDTICEKVAHRLNELKLAESPPAKGDKMQLWKHTHRDGPAINPAERRANVVLRDILGGTYGSEKSIVYYEELWYSVEDLKRKLFLRLKIMHNGKTEIKEVLVEKGRGAVSGLLSARKIPEYRALACDARPQMFCCTSTCCSSTSPVSQRALRWHLG